MENTYELYHYGKKGMKWGVRKKYYYDDSPGFQPRQSQPQYQPQPRRSSSPYTKALNRNGVATVNRLSQMAITGGLSAAAAKFAVKRGKKVTGAVLTSIGMLSVAGFGAALITDLARNNGGDDMQHSELYHWGIKGMRWGVRRYQNKDGTLTEAGERRYYREADKAGYKESSLATRARYRTTKKGKVERFNADPDKWVKDDLTRNRKLADESSTAANKLKQLNDNSIRYTKQNAKRMDLSNMSDKEMRDKINRAMLERQYDDMFNPRKETRGREYAGQILETTGTVLAIGSSALGIALAIKELKN